MAFHVFVEGATDDSPAGTSRLADAIARHYGLPAADLLARLQKGRFRVKGNIDRTAAEQYVRDLERLGARCTIEEATPQSSQRATPLPFPAVRPGTPSPIAQPRAPTPAPIAPTPAPIAPPRAPGAPPRAPTPPPVAQARAATPPPVGGQQYQSGLAAAFSGEQPAASLGALEREDVSFSLASVDGADEPASAPAGSFEPPGGGLPASIGPAPEMPKPLDIFAPPDAGDAELAVDIADDEKELSARKRASTPPPVEDAPRASQRVPTQPSRTSQPSLQAPTEPVTAVARTRKLGPLGEPRVRFAAGVLLALALGFAPAHVVAKMREESAYKAIDDTVLAAQQQATTPESYQMLDRMRADQLARKEGERRNAAIIALAIWALVAGAVAFVWFRKIPWDHYEA